MSRALPQRQRWRLRQWPWVLTCPGGTAGNGACLPGQPCRPRPTRAPRSSGRGRRTGGPGHGDVAVPQVQIRPAPDACIGGRVDRAALGRWPVRHHDIDSPGVLAEQNSLGVVFLDVAGDRRFAAVSPDPKSRRWRSLLRLVNAAGEPAQVRIRGIDDRGTSPGSTIRVTLPPRASTTLSLAELEAGGGRFEGSLRNGSGKWQLLLVDSKQSIVATSLLSSPTGHLTNLSTASGRDERPPRLLSPGTIGVKRALGWQLCGETGGNYA